MKTRDEIKDRIRTLQIRLLSLESDPDYPTDLEIQFDMEECRGELSALWWVLNN